MAVSAEFRDYVLGQLAALGDVNARRMFGGMGLRRGELFFALISGDVLYFKVDDSNRADYAALGARRFAPYADQPYRSMSYYEVPAQVLEDADECVAWARRSLAAALASPRRGPSKRPNPRGHIGD